MTNESAYVIKLMLASAQGGSGIRIPDQGSGSPAVGRLKKFWNPSQNSLKMTLNELRGTL